MTATVTDKSEIIPTNLHGYYLVIDPLSRVVRFRRKACIPPLNTAGLLWALVTKSIWKKYRSGDIVSPGDLTNKQLDRLRTMSV